MYAGRSGFSVAVPLYVYDLAGSALVVIGFSAIIFTLAIPSVSSRIVPVQAGPARPLEWPTRGRSGSRRSVYVVASRSPFSGGRGGSSIRNLSGRWSGSPERAMSASRAALFTKLTTFPRFSRASSPSLRASIRADCHSSRGSSARRSKVQFLSPHWRHFLRLQTISMVIPSASSITPFLLHATMVSEPHFLQVITAESSAVHMFLS